METSSSNSSETQDTQTIVITPTQLKELGLADQLKGVIIAQKSDREDVEVKEEDEEYESDERHMDVDEDDEENEAIEITEENEDVEEDEEDDNKKKILAIDPCNLQKTMRNKLCTLLNHTPLVMQVKNSPWHKTDNSNISINSKQVVNIELGEEIEDDKRKLTIFSNEKLNFTATEIENMLSSGKSVDSISSPGKGSQDVQEIEAQSTSQQDPNDARILKKQCLKRIQAKMYENLKKVLDEVDSFPVKDKAALSIKPLTTSEDLDTQSTKSTQNVAKIADRSKDSKENKPCYMSTYRERKIIELIDKNRPSSSPKPVDDVIVITDGDLSEKNTPSSEGMLPTSDSAVKIPKKRGRPPKFPLKTDSEVIIIETKSEEVQNTPTPEKIVRKRGRPPKKSIINVTIIEEMDKSEETEKIEETPQKADLEEPPKVEKQNGASGETPTPRKRGRPKKIRPIEPPEEEEEKEENKDDPEQSIIQQEPPGIESTPEVKIPKKRGRKPKAVILAMKEAERLKAEKNAEKTTDTSSSKEYTKSKSGRKRKIVNYSLLNGESSDYSPSDESEGDDLEPEIKVKSSKKFYRRKTVKEHTDDEDEDDDDEDEVDDYVESKKTVKRIRETDEEKDVVAKKSKTDASNKGIDAEKSNDAGRQTDESNKTDAPNETISDEKRDDESKKTDASDDGVAEKTNKIDAQQKNEKTKQTDASNDGIGAQQKTHESKETDACTDGIDTQQKTDESKKTDATNDEIDTQQKTHESKETDACSAGIADEIKMEKVKCGVCNVELEESWWLEHKRKIHNDLAWKNGEEPLVGQVE